jgi:dihydrofolate reductase
MIVAHGKNLEIGLNNQMLWHIKEDFQHFKKTTLGHHLIMGRKTFDSIGKALPGRKTIVLTRSANFSHADILVASSIEQALEMAKSNGETEVFIAGGANIYKQFLPLAHKLYISYVDFEGEADTYFPAIDEEPFNESYKKDYPVVSGKSPKWQLKILDRA